MSFTTTRRGVFLCAVLALLCSPAAYGMIDDEHRQQGERLIARAIAYLRTAQDRESGGWCASRHGREFPGITALVLHGMLLQPGIGADDPAVAAGLAFLLSRQQPDGGIHAGRLPAYNTALAVSALSRVDTPPARAARERALAFLRMLQFGEDAPPPGDAATAARVPRQHPFYGGVGYGGGGRPDLSNTAFFLQALHDAGVPADDLAITRALVFLQRVQMDHRFNDMPYAAGSRQGGFIYATASEVHRPDEGHSFAGTIEETLDDGTRVSRLRAYGSMTYAGFKSYLYAGLTRDDPRVQAAWNWLARHYTVMENPGLGQDGVYYYYVVMARALDAWGSPVIAVRTPAGDTVERDWANDLIERLAQLQNDDGSFRTLSDRWLENDPVLITAYALLALQHAVR